MPDSPPNPRLQVKLAKRQDVSRGKHNVSHVNLYCLLTYISQSNKPIKRKFREDYYPLVRVQRAPDPPACRNPHTTSIDEWIELSKIHVYPPTNEQPADQPRSLEYLLWKDNVDCILSVKRKEV